MTPETKQQRDERLKKAIMGLLATGPVEHLPKPTIDELEKILNEEPETKIHMRPDGSVWTTKPTVTTVEKVVEALARSDAEAGMVMVQRRHILAIKKMVVGEANDHGWAHELQTTTNRGLIADVCDIMLAAWEQGEKG